MDTGAYMANQMDDMITEGLILEEKFYEFLNTLKKVKKEDYFLYMISEVSDRWFTESEMKKWFVSIHNGTNLGICKEKNCNEFATRDYNGHKHYVCDYHDKKLKD